MAAGVAYELAIIGAGRVGQSLGWLLRLQGHRLTAVSCRAQLAAARAVAVIGAGQAFAYDDLPRLAERERPLAVLVTTNDALVPMIDMLARRQAHWNEIVVLHCSGALSSAVLSPLRQRGAHRGDTTIVARHLSALRDCSPLSYQVYCSLGTELVALTRQPGASPTALDDIAALLQPQAPAT